MSMRRQILVGAELEDRFLFPLAKPKKAAAEPNSGFTWFGWMTFLYTALGALAFTAGVILGWSVLDDAGTGWTTFYLSGLGSLTVGSLAVGSWWFVAGTGERRLREVLETRFGQRNVSDNVRPISH